MASSRPRDGTLVALRDLSREIWDFLRDSTPERRRQRYGDVEFDWDFRVNTTSATVGWRDRLLGVFHSPYQPTEPAVFHEMIARITEPLERFTFIDLGCGKGRTLLMASQYPFRRIIGVELLSELHRIAQQNIRDFRSSLQRCSDITSVRRTRGLSNSPTNRWCYISSIPCRKMDSAQSWTSCRDHWNENPVRPWSCITARFWRT